MIYLILLFIFYSCSSSNNPVKGESEKSGDKEEVLQDLSNLLISTTGNVPIKLDSSLVQIAVLDNEAIIFNIRLSTEFSYGQIRAINNRLTYEVYNKFGSQYMICFGYSYDKKQLYTPMLCLDSIKIKDHADRFNNATYVKLLDYYTDSIPLNTLIYYDNYKDSYFEAAYRNLGSPEGQEYDGEIDDLLYKCAMITEGIESKRFYVNYLFALSTLLYDKEHSPYIDELLSIGGFATSKDYFYEMYGDSIPR